MGALTQFACTACGKVLKSPKPIEEGKKIKCPHCQQVTVVGAAPRRTGADLGTATPRRPTRAPKPKRSNAFVMWGACFMVSLFLAIVVWVPASIAIRTGQSAVNEIDKGMKDRDKDPFKDLDKLKDKEFGKDPDKPKDKMD